METTNADFDPNDWYTWQTWERYGNGRVTVGVDESDTYFDTAGKAGGEKTHTLTKAEMPSHGNHLMTSYAYGACGNYKGFIDKSKLTAYGSGARGWNIWNKNEVYPGGLPVGGSGAHNNLQPYITAYRWRRTA